MTFTKVVLGGAAPWGEDPTKVSNDESAFPSANKNLVDPKSVTEYWKEYRGIT